MNSNKKFEKDHYKKPGNNELLRTWTGRYAGSGILYDNYDDDESGIYQNRYVSVRYADEISVRKLEDEGHSYKEAVQMFNEYVESMSGPVKTYHISELEKEN